jgi:hypothetical protein
VALHLWQWCVSGNSQLSRQSFNVYEGHRSRQTIPLSKSF